MFTVGCQGCLLVGKRSREVAWLGGTSAPVFICAWEVCLKCAAPGRAKWRSSLTPPPSLPGCSPWHGWAQEPGPRPPGPCDCRPGARLGQEKKFGGIAAVVVYTGREVASGDLGRWAEPVGEWSRALVGSSAEVGEGLVGSVP